MCHHVIHNKKLGLGGASCGQFLFLGHDNHNTLTHSHHALFLDHIFLVNFTLRIHIPLDELHLVGAKYDR